MKCLSLLLFAIFIAFHCYAQSVDFIDASDVLNISHTYGNTSEMGAGVSFVDFNQDGWDDLTLSTDSTFGISFYVNNGDGSYTKTSFGGLHDQGLHKQILWADIDNDGDYDLFVGANETGNHLYVNNGSMQFFDVTESSGLDSPDVDNNSFGAVFADFNDDGNLDLYISNRTIDGVYLPNGNIMHYGNGDGTFQNVTEETNSIDDNRAPLAVCAFDYDKDGFDDIYLAQDKNYGNTFLKNMDGATFEHVQEETNTDYYIDGMNSEVADIDNNGFLDIYVTDVNGGSLLLMNDGNGNFENEAVERGCGMVGDFGWGTSFVDIDNDLDLDIYASNSTLSQAKKNRLFVNDGTGNFELANIEYGFETDSLRTFGNMFGDINNDGFPDIVTNNYAGDSQVWQNSGNNNNWFKYKLKGTVSNRDATGSFLYFYVGGNSYLRTTHSGQGFLSQQSYTKTFGLDNYPKADSLLIVWPSGFEEWHYDLQAGETHVFSEGETFTAGISSSAGSSICAGIESVLSINGDYESVLWNEETESETLTITSSGVYVALITNEFGVQFEDSIEIFVANETLDVYIEQGLSICPDQNQLQVTAEVISEEEYSLIWDGEFGTDTAIVEIGVHTVSVIDELGCEASYEFEVTQTEDIVFDEILTHVTCNGGNDGQLILDVNGANPFNITIEGEESGIIANNLTAGIYSVEVTDNNGCSIATDVEIIQPEPIVYEVNTSPDFGEAEGSITLFNISGGTEPYILNGDSIFELLNLNAGLFELELCDQNECCLEFNTLVEFQIGIEESLVEKFNIYYIPSSEQLVIEDLNSMEGDTEFSIYNSAGKRVKTLLLSKGFGSYTLSLSDFNSGVYLIHSSSLHRGYKIVK